MTDHPIVEVLYRWRVRTGTILILAVGILARPTASSLAAGGAAAVAGLALRAWSSGHLNKEKILAVSGPYRHTRNPLYLGNLVIGAGVATAAYSWAALALLAAYFGVFYPLIIAKERERMRRLFKEKYDVYAKNVPLFFPGLRRSARNGTRFDRRLYTVNREYRAAAAAIIVWLVLAVKMILL